MIRSTLRAPHVDSGKICEYFLWHRHIMISGEVLK